MIILITSCAMPPEQYNALSGNQADHLIDLKKSDDTTGLIISENFTIDILKPQILSDDEAFKTLGTFDDINSLVFNAYHATVSVSRGFRSFFEKSDDTLKIANETYYKIGKETIASGNFRCGDYEWMQEIIQKTFTKDFIDEYYSYEVPSPFIYYKDAVYARSVDNDASTLWDHYYDTMKIVSKTHNKIRFEYDCYYFEGQTEEFRHPDVSYIEIQLVDGDWYVSDFFDASITCRPTSMKDGRVIAQFAKEKADLIAQGILDDQIDERAAAAYQERKAAERAELAAAMK